MDIVKSYLNRNKVKPLSKEEVYELIPKAQAKDKEAINKLVIHNLPILLNLAYRHSWAIDSVSQFDDFFQQGIFGLMRAIEKFDISRNLAFSTYSTIWINQAIGRYVEDNRGPVRIPNYLHSIRSKYNKLKEDENGLHNDDFYMRLVANQNETTVATLRYSITSGSNSINEVNEDGECYDDLESLVDENEINVNLLDFKTMIAKIGGRDKEVISRRLEGWTLSEIAQTMDLSREMVRLIEDSAMMKLKAMIANVTDNNPFQIRYNLSREFATHLTEVVRKKEIKDPIRIDSSKQYNPILGACNDCMYNALRQPENMSKVEVGTPSWVRASCDICGKITACTSPKSFMFPVFVITSERQLV